MSDAKHTDGPWHHHLNTQSKRQVSAFSDDGNRILCVVIESFNVAADARLIAAAPELLAALERSLDWLALMSCQSSTPAGAGYPGDGAVGAYDQARAAIAKAMGTYNAA